MKRSTLKILPGLALIVAGVYDVHRYGDIVSACLLFMFTLCAIGITLVLFTQPVKP